MGLPENVLWSFYDPATIFTTESDLTGGKHIELAKAFHGARFDDRNEYLDPNRELFERNAGAVQLYKDGNPVKGKTYKFLSFGNKKLYKSIGYKKTPSNYGHTEKILLIQLLNELINKDGECYSEGCQEKIYRPNDLRNFKAEQTTYVDVLLHLGWNPDDRTFSTEFLRVCKHFLKNLEKYKQFFMKNNYTIKMWSERNPCYNENDDGIIGEYCSVFLPKILPEGSKLGYTIKNYTRGDNGKEIVKQAIEKLQEAYRNNFEGEDGSHTVADSKDGQGAMAPPKGKRKKEEEEEKTENTKKKRKTRRWK